MPIPKLQALVLADFVYQDAFSGKKVIAGVFNRIFTRQFGGFFHRISYAYVCLTNIEGRISLELRYVDLSDNTVLMGNEFEVESTDRFLSVEVFTEVPPLPLPHEGVYAFEVHSDNVLLGSLRIKVEKMPEGERE